MTVLGSQTPPSPLTVEDVKDLKYLYEELRRICTRANERGITVIIDIEHTWYTPAIDAITLALTREFNKVTESRSTPLVFGTYQSYLRRGIAHLQSSISDAKKGGYTLGIKLVRGAYQPLELSFYAKGSSKRVGNTDSEPPVWREKSLTDNTYNASVGVILSSLKTDRLANDTPCVSVLFGTHNQDSCNVVLNGLVDRGLADREITESGSRIRIPKQVADRVSFGQLLGMRDELTQYLVDTVIAPSPIVLKYIPYGALHEVIPYLARRAVENNSVLGGTGGAADERRIAGAELRKRLFFM